MTRRLLVMIMLLVGALFLFTGCIKRGYDVFKDKCPSSWSRAQKEAAWAWWLRGYYGKEAEDGTYVIDASKVSVDDVLITVQSILEDINWILDPQRSPRWRALLLEMPTLKQAFEKEENKWLYIRSQMTKVKVYYSFLELLGQTVTAEDKAYDVLYLWPENTEFDYSAPWIEKAKEEGKLIKAEEGFYYVYTPYGEKVPDPSDPLREREVWKPSLQGFWVVSYLITTGSPDELKSDYVEIYRARIVEDRIEKETLPCLRAFRKLGGRVLEVAVIDYDHEGESGYGEPDEVKPIYADTGWKLLNRYDVIRRDLSVSRTEERAFSRKVELPPLELVIVKWNEIDEYKGEYKEEGWQVPYQYKDQYEANWVAEVVREAVPDGYPFQRLAYVVKIWNNRSVWEYWQPKPEYTGDLQTLRVSGKNIVIQKVGDSVVELSADAVLSTIYKIVYKEGDVWVALVDLDGTGKLQYKLVNVSPPDSNKQTKEKVSAGSIKYGHF